MNWNRIRNVWPLVICKLKMMLLRIGYEAMLQAPFRALLSDLVIIGQGGYW